MKKIGVTGSSSVDKRDFPLVAGGVVCNFVCEYWLDEFGSVTYHSHFVAILFIFDLPFSWLIYHFHG